MFGDKIKKYFTIEANRNIDHSVGLGFDIYFHNHFEGWPVHFHICITFLLWFIEIQIGKEFEIKENTAFPLCTNNSGECGARNGIYCMHAIQCNPEEH